MKKEKTEKVIQAKTVFLGLLLLAGVFLTGCSSGPVAFFSDLFGGEENSRTAEAPRAPASPALPHGSLAGQPEGSLLLAQNSKAADAIAEQLLRRLGSGSGVLAANLVELNNLERSSVFGQVVSQQVGSRLSQHGFKVLESRLGAELRMDKASGEYMLTRESARLMAQNHNANSVLLGVYTETRQRVFVSVRVVRLNDNAVIGAYEYYLPKTDDVLTLLSPSRQDRAYLRSSHEQAWSGLAARERAFPQKK